MAADPADDDERQGVGLEDGADEEFGIDDQPHAEGGCTSLRV